jgi:cyclic pyranopterin phosphate synthase
MEEINPKSETRNSKKYQIKKIRMSTFGPDNRIIPPMRLSLLPDLPRALGPETGPRSISAVRVLRISITDRCNFRCVYCMPEEGVQWLPRDHILSFDEIADVVRAAVDIHGIRRFKLTGGEPTIRNGLPELVRMLRRINGVQDLSLTTNGMRLVDLARPLKNSGLDRITISIDSLNPDRFKRITRSGDLTTVLRGLDRVTDVGFINTKINCVTMRGTNDDEFADFARLTLDRPLTVRFIEYMPLGDAAVMHSQFPRELSQTDLGPAAGCDGRDRGADALIPESQIRESIEAELGQLIPVERSSESGVGPATVYRLPGGVGRIGFISAMSKPFCAACNRLRVTADGVLRSCLFEGGEVPIRDLLRNPSLKDKYRALADAMIQCVRLKPEIHSNRGHEPMSRIGG